jgi:hypothetical protein
LKKEQAMTELLIPVDVPENRQVTITLPADVPVGPFDLVLSGWPRGQRSEPAIVLTPTLPPRTISQNEEKWQKEYQAFLKLLPDLLQTRRGQYVAVYDGEMIDSGPTKADLALRVYKQYGKIHVCIRLVTEQPPPVIHMPSIRIRELGRVD